MNKKSFKIYILTILLFFTLFLIGCENICNHIDNNTDNMCDNCDATIKSTIKTVKTINTNANDIFFSTERSNLHIKEIEKAYEKYIIDTNKNVEKLGEYKLYNLISKEKSQQYNLDIFEVYCAQESIFCIKHNDNIYELATIYRPEDSLNCINHIAITDINDDGNIEILISIISFKSASDNWGTNVYTFDTSTKIISKVYGWKNILYFKEDLDNVVCIYKTEGLIPYARDFNNGKFKDKYYEFAYWVYDTPKLNVTSYEFKEKKFKASCNLYEVEIIVNDNGLNFPYIFENASTLPYFKINVKMTYLGEPFTYVNSNTYLDGAVASFVSEENTIDGVIGGVAGDQGTPFNIYTGMVIDRNYKYYQTQDSHKNGIYDMIITYENEYNNIKESITIKEFLKIYK